MMTKNTKEHSAENPPPVAKKKSLVDLFEPLRGKRGGLKWVLRELALH